MSEDSVDGEIIKKGLAFVKKDWIIIAICLVSVLICLVAYMNTAIVLRSCNDNCMKEFESKCMNNEKPELYNTGEKYPVLNLSNWVVEDET